MYDRQTFNNLLIKAMGGRTQNKFAADSGVSVAYICRIFKGDGKSAPSPEIIQKIAAAARNNVTYEDLMKAAGHISSSQVGTDSTQATGGYDLSFLENEIIEWVINPDNAKFIRFIYKANKKGLTKELLDISKFTVDFKD